jgi:hypothetical protein
MKRAIDPTALLCAAAFVASAVLAAPALAQSSAAPSATPPKPAGTAPAKPKPNTTAKRPAPTTPAEEAALPAADGDQMAAAERVYYGKYGCDDKHEIHVERNGKQPGYVNLRHQKNIWVMKPVASNTGAIRLEDTKNNVLLVQIPNKSILLNVRSGQRMVDSCRSDVQEAAAREEAAATPAAAPAAKQ